MNNIRCKKCKYPMDLPGCDDAEKHDPRFTEHCRGCAVRFYEAEEYNQHLLEGGRPYIAGMSDGRGRITRRLG
jgi:hypothetical protein